MSNLVKYETFTEADAAEVDAAVAAIQGDIYDFKDGKNGPFRILPAPVGKKALVKGFVHFVQKPGEKKQVVFPCPVDFKNPLTKGTCPVCAYVDALRKTGNSKDRDLANDMRPKLQVYVCAINRKDADRGPTILRFGAMIWDQLGALLKDPDTGGNWTDPTENGYDIVIEKIVDKKQVSYAVRPVMKRLPLGNMDWIEQAPDLQKFVAPKDPAEIAAMLGIEPADPVDGAKAVGGTASRTAAGDIGDGPKGGAFANE